MVHKRFIGRYIKLALQSLKSFVCVWSNCKLLVIMWVVGFASMNFVFLPEATVKWLNIQAKSLGRNLGTFLNFM